MKKVLLKIDGMTCSACSSGLEKYLNKQDGIKTAVVNLVMNNANIEYDEKKLTLEQVEKFVEKAGFTNVAVFDKNNNKISSGTVIEQLPNHDNNTYSKDQKITLTAE